VCHLHRGLCDGALKQTRHFRGERCNRRHSIYEHTYLSIEVSSKAGKSLFVLRKIRGVGNSR
jgi:hypothetical protein